jgi:hypothetical protein
MNLWMRQIASVLRLEMKKTFLSRRGWWVYFLALGPVALTMIHWLIEIGNGSGHHTLGEDSLVFAGLRGALRRTLGPSTWRHAELTPPSFL